MRLRDLAYGYLPFFQPADGGGAAAGAAGAAGGADAAAGAQGQGGGGSALELAQRILADADAAAKATQGQGQGQQGQEQQGQGQGAQGAGYRPEGLAAELAGKDDKETIDKLFGAHKTLSEAAAKRGEVPKTADAYKLEIADPAAKKALFGDADPAKDPGLKIWAQVAHELGFSQKEFNAIGRFAELAAQQGVIGERKFDPRAEIRLLGEDLKDREPDAAKREAEGARRVVAINTWLGGLETRKTIDQAERQTLAALTTTAHGVRLLEKLSKLGGGTGVQAAAGGAEGGGSVATEHEKRMRAMYPSMFKG